MKLKCLSTKTITIIIILIIILVSFIPATGEFLSENNSEISRKDRDITNDLIFNLKMRSLMRICHIPSISTCIIENNSITFQKAYGYSDVYRRNKATTDTIYIIGSISKTIIATALMQLYEKGVFDLDDNVSEYLPFDLKNPKYPNINITFRMLLSHQSSLDDTFLDIIFYYPFRGETLQWVKERVIPGEKHYKEKYWQDYLPGDNLNYSNLGFIILTGLIEILSGQSFESYCSENIFLPLQMYNTSFHVENLDKNRLARPNFHVFGKFYLPFFHYDMGCIAAIGGLRTTVEDLSHFVIVHMNNGTWKDVRILNKSTVELMHTIQYPEYYENLYSLEVQHGLGWLYIDIENELYGGYSGGAFGFSCIMMIDESDNKAVLMLGNGQFKRFSPQFVLRYRMKAFHNLGTLLLQKSDE